MLKVGVLSVRYVDLGERYGRDDCQINTLAPMVEFYDSRFGHSRYPGRGQFICRIKTEYLFLPQCWQGITLDERVPKWRLDTKQAQAVREYINEQAGVLHACLL